MLSVVETSRGSVAGITALLNNISLAFPKRRGKVDCAKNERKTDRGLLFDN